MPQSEWARYLLKSLPKEEMRTTLVRTVGGRREVKPLTNLSYDEIWEAL